MTTSTPAPIYWSAAWARVPEPPRWPNDGTITLTQYGLTLLHYLIAYDSPAVMHLTDRQIDLARAAVAVASRGAYADRRVYDHIATIARTLTGVARARAANAAIQAAAIVVAAGIAPHRPDVGPMAPLCDRPIARPPAPTRLTATIPF